MSEEKSAIDVEVWLPPFIESAEEEIANHKTQATKTLKYMHEQYNTLISYCENVLALEGSYRCRPTEYTHYETLLKKLQRECDADENKAFKLDQSIKSLETELKSLRSQNEQIQDEILQKSEDIEKLALQEEQLTKQRKEATESMQLMWRTYVTAKNMYKKNLLCHIRLHEPVEKTAETSDSELEETLTFSYLLDDRTLLEVNLNRHDNRWKMLDTQPFVPAAMEAQKNLHETNDIRDFICRLREEALKLSKK